MARNFYVWLIISLVMVVAGADMVLAAPKADFFSKALIRMDKNGADEQTLWNMGFLWFNQFGPTLEMARTISEAYSRASAKVAKPVIQKGAAYWRREVEYWGRVKPGDKNRKPSKPYAWLPRREWESSLNVFPPGDRKYRSDTNFTTRYNSRYRPPEKKGWKSDMKMYRSRGR